MSSIINAQVTRPEQVSIPRREGLLPYIISLRGFILTYNYRSGLIRKDLSLDLKPVIKAELEPMFKAVHANESSDDSDFVISGDLKVVPTEEMESLFSCLPWVFLPVAFYNFINCMSNLHIAISWEVMIEMQLHDKAGILVKEYVEKSQSSLTINANTDLKIPASRALPSAILVSAIINMIDKSLIQLMADLSSTTVRPQ